MKTHTNGDVAGTTVVITGGNSGIGLATARALSADGAHVVLAVRDVRKGEAAAATIAGHPRVLPLDLADLESVRAFAAAWDGPIDLLINNAGISTPELRFSVDGFELQLATNHLGPFALTNLLLGNITGRVVTLGSQAERMGRIDFDDLNFESEPYKRSAAYSRSKLANILFTTELQRRLREAGSPVLAETAHPGFVATDIYSDSGPVAKTLVRLLAQSTEAGALSVLHAALGDIPGDSFVGPRHLMHMRGAPELIKRSARASDPDLARRLWAVSEQLTATEFPLAPAGVRR